MGHITLAEWVRRYEAGEFDSPDVETMMRAGWHDWFCSDESLLVRLERLAPLIVAASKATALYNPSKVCVFLKNNCPIHGPTYDSFSIYDPENDDVVFWVSPGSVFHDAAVRCGRDEFEVNLLPEGERNDAGIRRWFESHKREREVRKNVTITTGQSEVA